MKIFYSPYYNDTVYTGLDGEKTIRMDEMIVDNKGLINHLQLILGVHHTEVSHIERLTQYYRELRSWLNEHKDNELYEPFKAAGLDVARKCMMWHDALCLCGWSAKSSACSDRLKVLQAVAQTFDTPSEADYISEIVEAIKSSTGNSCSDITLAMPCEVDMLHPAMQRVVEAMVQHGAMVDKNENLEVVMRVKDANIPNLDFNNPDHVCKSNLTRVAEMLRSDSKEKIELDEQDESFLIYNFANDREAAQYMAVQSGRHPYQLWINPASKTTDNWLRQMGKPTMGSSTPDSVPQVAQLLMLGIGLFERPLNIHTLLDWLQPDIHPLGGWFRRELSDAITTQGGYNNDACKKVIANYLEGNYTYADEKEATMSEEELKKLKAKRRKQREELLDSYLPIQKNGGEVEREHIRQFVASMELWAKTRAHLMAEGNRDSLWIAQLHSLAQMAHAMLLLLEDVATPTMPYQQLANWAGSLFHSEEYGQYAAECGSQMAITSPGAMIAMAEETIWWNMEGGSSPALCCDFLLPSERKTLKNELSFWDAGKEAALQQLALITPVTNTRYMLRMAQCETRGGEPTQKHPLIVRIENQVKNWQKFVYRPDLKSEKWEDVERTCNETGMSEITFNHKDYVKWPDHLSATSMDTLIQWPLDFIMDKVLGLQATASGVLPELRTTKGNVAHAVIKYIFDSRKEGEKPTADIIKERINKEYEEAFMRMVEAHGAILNLPENKLEAQLLKEQLRNSLGNLVTIIENNKLKVTGCEHFVEGHLGVLSDDKEVNDVIGFIDMTLEDENYHPVVFDFKWTAHKKYYQGLLTKNESVQLQLYRRMMELETKDEVKRVGYFLMPEGKLYSTETFEEPYCVQVDCEDTSNLLEKVHKSVAYRMKQISNGVIENGDGKVIAGLSYGQKTEQEGLVPLKAYKEGVHDANKFSNYNLFKK